MVKFKELGFESFEEYFDSFLNSLLLSNKTYEYFVDWNKVKTAIKTYIIEISLLNSLTKVPSPEKEKHLFNLLLKYPKTIEVIPLLIAERIQNGRINIFDLDKEEIIEYNFKPSNINENIISQVINFCKKTGILSLFEEINDVYDYLMGVEVGIDTNARKNRSGEIFENMCQQKINKLLEKEKEYKVINNDPQFSLYPGKTHDMVIYKNNEPFLIIECNFYNVAGSKPISISESYIEMHKKAKERKLEFLWITDGPAWNEMKEPLKRSMQELDWVLNFKMLEKIKIILKLE